MQFVQITLAYVQTIFFFLRNVWRDLRLPSSTLATVARKKFNGKFTTKIDFPIGYFILPLLMLTSSVHTLFDKYLDHILVKFEQIVCPNHTKFCAF